MKSDESKDNFWTFDNIIIGISIFFTIIPFLLGFTSVEKEINERFKQESAKIFTMQYANGSKYGSESTDEIPIIFHDDIKEMKVLYRNKFLSTFDDQWVIFIGKVDSLDTVMYDKYFISFDLDNTTFNFDCLFEPIEENFKGVSSLSIGDTVCIRGKLSDGLGGSLMHSEILYIF